MTHAILLTLLLGTVQTGDVWDGLVGYWPSDSSTLGSTTLARELTGNGPELTANGSPSFSANGIEVNSATPDYLKILTSGYRGSDTSGTVCGWFEPDTVSTAGIFFSVNDEDTGTSYMSIGVDGSARMFFTYRDGVTPDRLETTGTVTVNTWVHLCVSSNGSRYLAYIDSASAAFNMGAGSDSGNWIGDLTSTTDNVMIGAQERNTGIASPADGVIFGVMLWNRELSATEIEYVYAQGRRVIAAQTGYSHKGLVGSWPLTSSYKASATVMRDASVYGNELTLVNSPTVASDGTTFNGSTQYAIKTVADFRSNDLLGSICMWTKESASASDILLESSDTATNNFRFSLQVNTGGTYRLGVVDGGAVTVDIETDTGGYNDNAWHQWCLTSNGSRYLMYVDGSPAAFSVNAGSDNGSWLGDIANRDNLTIAAGQTSTGVFGHFPGSIGFVVIYSIELSATEVGYIYAQDRRIVAVQTGSLNKNLTLDVPATSEFLQSATVVSDRSATAAHMTSTGGGTIAATGTTLNGSSQYLRAAASGFGSGDSAGTVACWGTPSGSGGGTLFAVADESTTSEYVYFRLFTSGTILFGQQSGAGVDSVQSDSSVWSDGVPGFWAVTTNGSRYLMYSSDGLEAHSVLTGADSGDWLGDISGASSIVFGAFIRSSGTALYLSGEHRGCVYYGRELSAAELVNLNTLWGP